MCKLISIPNYHAKLKAKFCSEISFQWPRFEVFFSPVETYVILSSTGCSAWGTISPSYNTIETPNIIYLTVHFMIFLLVLNNKC